MPWNFNNNTPIYLQIMDHIMLSIAVGEYKAGDKLLPVRELAAEAEVNPNTMQKALSELERDGLLYSQRTSGRYITDDAEKITALRKNLATGHMEYFLNKMGELGFSKEAALEALRDFTETDGKGEN
ncbi:MAG: GntR family transcriptional regulator [Oscillospiraceae bacterium]